MYLKQKNLQKKKLLVEHPKKKKSKKNKKNPQKIKKIKLFY